MNQPNDDALTSGTKPKGFLAKMRLMRMVMESIYFEKEAVTLVSNEDKRPEVWKGLLGVIAIALVQTLLLALWVGRDTRQLEASEIAALSNAQYYSQTLAKGDIMGMLKSPPSADGLPAAPFYYWTLVPVVRHWPAKAVGAAVLLNSFYILLLCASVYLIVRRRGLTQAALLAAAIVSSLPFVLESAQRISPDLALIAFTAGTYATFIWTEEFRTPVWTYLWGLCSLAGLLTSWAFPVCVFPVLNMLPYGMLSHVTRSLIMRVFFACLGIYALWLLSNFSGLALWFTAHIMPALAAFDSSRLMQHLPEHVYAVLGNMRWYAYKSVDALQLPFALASAALGAWFFTARFAAFPFRTDIAYWFGAPLVLLSVFSVRETAFYLPSLTGCAVACAVMLPPPLRLAAWPALAVFSLAYQAGILLPAHIYIKGRPVTVWEGRQASRSGANFDSMLASLRGLPPAANGAEAVVAVVKSSSVKPYYLNWRASRLGVSGVTFIDESSSPAVYPELLLAPVDISTQALAARFGDIANPAGWFAAVYEKKSQYQFDNGESAVLYAQRKLPAQPYPSGRLALKTMRLGGLTVNEVELELGPWNAQKQVYDWAKVAFGVVYSGQAEIYGIRLQLKDIAFTVDDVGRTNAIKVLKLAALKVEDASISDRFAIEYLPRLVAELQQFRVAFGGAPPASGEPPQNNPDADIAAVEGKYRDVQFSGKAYIKKDAASGGIAVTFKTLRMGGFSLPDFMLAHVRYDIPAKASLERPFAFYVDEISYISSMLSIHSRM